MSLINDALKRTQDQTQGEAPPRLADLDLRPIDSASMSTERGDRPRILMWIVVVMVVLGNVALFALFKTVKSGQPVNARTAEEEYQTLAESALTSPAPVETAVTFSPAPSSGVAPAPATPPAEVIAEPSPLPETPEFRLKTVVSHPTRPSAMINDRVVFVGDRVEGYSVVAIRKDEVTLKLEDHEVVVSLP